MIRTDDEGASSGEDQDAIVAAPAEFDELLEEDSTTAPSFATTSFDHYFAQASKPAKTSSNIFSAQTTLLAANEYAAAVNDFLIRPPPVARPTISIHLLFAQFLVHLESGFNLILYGAGSKRRVLNSFAQHVLSARQAHVLVVNGTAPEFDCRHILASIDRIPGVSSFPSTRLGVEGQMARIAGYFGPETGSPQLYLAIHNVDAPSFRTPKGGSILSWLCANPSIHAIASVDNIAFPVSFSSDGRKTRQLSRPGRQTSAWLWHDVQTLEPYDIELSSVDRTSLAGASRVSSAPSKADAKNPAALLSPEAAQHILLSVTQKAKKLFALLGSRQLQFMKDTDVSAKDIQGFGTEYSTLFGLARENFIATSDTSLRALMSEFKDHNLMLSCAQPGGAEESLWIPLRKKALSDLITNIEQDRM